MLGAFELLNARSIQIYIYIYIFKYKIIIISSIVFFVHEQILKYYLCDFLIFLFVCHWVIFFSIRIFPGRISAAMLRKNCSLQAFKLLNAPSIQSFEHSAFESSNAQCLKVCTLRAFEVSSAQRVRNFERSECSKLRTL